MKPHINYFKGLLKHKWWVFVYAVKLGVPFHIAIFHDASKFSFREWVPYVRNFYNPDGTKRSVRDKSGAYDISLQSQEFQRAWLSHQKNKHHWQAWISLGDGGAITALDIPEKYIREMIADWCGAGISHSGKTTPTPITWYEKNKDSLVLSNESRYLLERILYSHFDDEDEELLNSEGFIPAMEKIMEAVEETQFDISKVKTSDSLGEEENSAFCMNCGKEHPYYKFTENQTAYTLWCENCGTRMHSRERIIR